MSSDFRRTDCGLHDFGSIVLGMAYAALQDHGEVLFLPSRGITEEDYRCCLSQL